MLRDDAHIVVLVVSDEALVILVDQVLDLGVVDCILNNIVTFWRGFGIIASCDKYARI